jgi:hypothetical protein
MATMALEVTPFRENTTLDLLLDHDGQTSAPATVKVLRCHNPSTLSCVLEVELSDPTMCSHRMILKLYDRRFSTQLRADEKVQPWTPEREAKFRDFVHSGSALQFYNQLCNEDDFEEPEEGWDDAENETYLQHLCLEKFGTETATYDRLKDLQEREFPKLFAKVAFATDPNDSTREGFDLLGIKGILIQYIPGVTLSQLANSDIPGDYWQQIADDALQIVHHLSDYEILNKDVRPANFLVTLEDTRFKVFMIDLAECRFREDGESDFSWGRAKHRQDEEGAVGFVMKNRLKQVGFELEYKPSGRFLRWAESEAE